MTDKETNKKKAAKNDRLRITDKPTKKKRETNKQTKRETNNRTNKGRKKEKLYLYAKFIVLKS